jgi:hypothetical protein
MTSKTSKTVQVGDIVFYQGSHGELPAMVLMTPETFDAAKAGYEAPAPDSVSLEIHRISGRTYVRHGVPLEGSEAHKALIDAKAVQEAEKAAFDAPGIPADADDEESDPWAPKPKTVVVRSWKPRA